MQLCGGLNWRILELKSLEPISPSLQVSRALTAKGHKKPVVKALKPACWVVMSFDAQNALIKNFLLEGKNNNEKNILELLFAGLCGRQEGDVLLRGYKVSPLLQSSSNPI